MRHTDANRSPDSDTHPRWAGSERRHSPRIETPFPAIVRSVDVDDQPFEEYTILDNLSSGGLYLRLVRQVQPGIRLFALIQLPAGPSAGNASACIAFHGLALRIDPRPGCAFGTAIKLTHHRFIYTRDLAARRADFGGWGFRRAPAALS